MPFPDSALQKYPKSVVEIKTTFNKFKIVAQCNQLNVEPEERHLTCFVVKTGMFVFPLVQLPTVSFDSLTYHLYKF